ncbi:hypothetical protein [Neobacillus vireti]|uniref:magnesium chelatase subunit ChlI family protein n=1 Tax=Neobacillus vireti TaxID=220686 RepID=UPI002FFF3DF0
MKINSPWDYRGEFIFRCLSFPEFRLHQFERYQSEVTNAKVPFEQITQTIPYTNEQQRMLTNVSVKQNWSNRVQIKIIVLARTISDFAGENKIPTMKRYQHN